MFLVLTGGDVSVIKRDIWSISRSESAGKVDFHSLFGWVRIKKHLPLTSPLSYPSKVSVKYPKAQKLIQHEREQGSIISEDFRF